MTYTKKSSALMIGLALFINGTPALAGDVIIPTTFTSGTPAVAAQVNGNFTAVKTAVDDNNQRIAELEAQLSNIMALNPYITVNTAGGIPNVTFSGINVQVVNGEGSTGTTNGTGNLIVGYDEVDSSGTGHCTLAFDGLDQLLNTEALCIGAGATWSVTGFKTGSHYIVAGSENNYSSYGGVVFGRQNTSNATYANVTGGNKNTASGAYSSVSGGTSNAAISQSSSILGGQNNTANVFVQTIPAIP